MGVEASNVFEVQEIDMSPEAELILNVVAKGKLGNTRKPWLNSGPAYDPVFEEEFTGSGYPIIENKFS